MCVISFSWRILCFGGESRVIGGGGFRGRGAAVRAKQAI